MKRVWTVMAMAGAITAGLCASAANAEDGPWEVRLRAAYFDPGDRSNPITSAGIPSDALHVNTKWRPDFDFEYSFAPHWSAELDLTLPQVQTLTVEKSVSGPLEAGTFRQLPAYVMGKYTLFAGSMFRPYAGVGLGLTDFYRTSLKAIGPFQLSQNNIGPAGELGMDVRISAHWWFNLEAKWSVERADLQVDGVKVSNLQIDPLVASAGVGYRFGSAH